MITSILFSDIKSITLEKDGEEFIQIINVKRKARYKSLDVISFGINAIFGQFECILDEQIKKLL